MRVETIGDAVFTGVPDAVVINYGHEKPAKRQRRPPQNSSADVGTPASRNHRTVCQWDILTEGYGKPLWRYTSCPSAGAQEARLALQIPRKGRRAERQVQGWITKPIVSRDDCQGSVQQVRRDALVGHSPHRRGSYQQRGEQSRSAVLTMPFKPPQAGMVEQKEGFEGIKVHAPVADDPANSPAPDLFEGAL